MKVAVIHGQVHKRNTYRLTQQLIEKLNCESSDITEFTVNGIGHCVGCYNCIMKDEKLCPHRIDVEPIIEAIEAADVIVLASPTYVMGMSGQLKTFCDHMAYRWMVHRPHASMKHKIGVAISTTAGAGAKKVTKDICNQFTWWSIGKSYQIPFAVSASSFDEVKPKRRLKLESKINKIAKAINKKQGKGKPSLKTKFLFFILKQVQKSQQYNPVDKEYWKSQGWIQ